MILFALFLLNFGMELSNSLKLCNGTFSGQEICLLQPIDASDLLFPDAVDTGIVTEMSSLISILDIPSFNEIENTISIEIDFKTLWNDSRLILMPEEYDHEN